MMNEAELETLKLCIGRARLIWMIIALHHASSLFALDVYKLQNIWMIIEPRFLITTFVIRPEHDKLHLQTFSLA
jgi:hypothetical protein